MANESVEALSLGHGSVRLLKRVWSQIALALTRLPPPLSNDAARLLNGMAERNQAREPWQYFLNQDAYPTPQVALWLGEHYLPDDEEFIADTLRATLWLFLFIRLQDDVLDEAGAPLIPLLLGNVCIEQALRGFYLLLPADQAFVSEITSAWTSFSAATAWEKAEHWGRAAPFDPEDLDRLGEKFAPIRIPVAAILCRAGRADLIPAYRRCLQDLGTAVQMKNDLTNAPADLASGNFTYFLTLAGGDPERAIAAGTAAEVCLATAERYLRRAMDALPIDAPASLRAHLEQRIDGAIGQRRALVHAKLGILF